MADDIPPTAEIEGVDLVTEGVITVNKVLSYAQDYLKDNETYSQWAYKQDGASQIARLLFEEATDINFFVGRAINPAHQNPDLPINFQHQDEPGARSVRLPAEDGQAGQGELFLTPIFIPEGAHAMRKFDTKVQYLKYKVLREVARQAWQDTLLENVLDIPKIIVPGKQPTMRCCVYKERAILAERVKLAMGGSADNPNVIEVIDIACDECPVGGYEVTNACRGCLAHRCEDVCRRGAISFDENHVAHIDKTKCVECGQCAKVCPYTAIVSRKRPCQNACKVKAISMNEEKAATIDNNKCISCGACVYQCPFGAIMDKSYMLDVIDLLRKSEQGRSYKLYAIVAPSISSQFNYARLGQVISGLKALGFHTVVEAALGADMVAEAESRELAEKGFLTSSCCPAFVTYIRQELPAAAAHGIAQSVAHGGHRALYQGDRRPTQRPSLSAPARPRRPRRSWIR